MIAIREQFTRLALRYSTRPTVLFLVLCAFSWAVLLLWPGESMGSADYIFMKEIGDDVFWGLLFALYGALALWRLFGQTQPAIALLINLMGLTLFSLTFMSVVVSGLRPIPAGWGHHFAIMLAAVWVFVRSRGEDDKPET